MLSAGRPQEETSPIGPGALHNLTPVQIFSYRPVRLFQFVWPPVQAPQAAHVRSRITLRTLFVSFSSLNFGLAEISMLMQTPTTSCWAPSRSVGQSLLSKQDRPYQSFGPDVAGSSLTASALDSSFPAGTSYLQRRAHKSTPFKLRSATGLLQSIGSTFWNCLPPLISLSAWFDAM